MVSRSYRIGNAEVGVRTTSAEFGDWLDLALGPYRIRKRLDPEYSIVIDGGEEDEGRRGRRFHILYQGVGSVIRTMHLPTLAGAFLSELETRLLDTREDAVFAHYGLAWSDGVSVLLPAWMVSYLGGTGRRLEKEGITLSTSRWVAVDLETAEILPRPRFLEFPDGAVEDLARQQSNVRGPDRGEVDRRRRVDAVLTYAPELDTIQPGSRGIALHALAGAAANLRATGGDGLRALADVVAAAHCFDTGLGRAQQMLRALADVVEHERAHRGEHERSAAYDARGTEDTRGG